MRYVIEGPSGTKIRELNLTNCLRVSDVSVLRIAQRCVLFTCRFFLIVILRFHCVARILSFKGNISWVTRIKIKKDDFEKT